MVAADGVRILRSELKNPIPQLETVKPCQLAAEALAEEVANKTKNAPFTPYQLHRVLSTESTDVKPADRRPDRKFLVSDSGFSTS